MTTRALFRFAAVRPAEAAADYINLVQFPATEPQTDFQRSLLAKGQQKLAGGQDAGKSADAKSKSVADAGTTATTLDLRSSPTARAVLGTLPELLRMARQGDTATMLSKLGTLTEAGLGTAALAEGALWDSFLDTMTKPRKARRGISGVMDGLRLSEARRRSDAGRDPVQVAAALKGSIVVPPWALAVLFPSTQTPAQRGIVPAGVADLLVVEERLLRYELGEISYIENVMKTEKKERHYRSLDRSFTSYTVTTEATEESERDLQTTQRAEVQSEITETVHTEMSLAAGVAISASYGPFVTVDASLDTALGTSSDSSTTVSNTFAQDLVDRTVSKVSTSRKEELIQQTLQEIEERSLHGFDNTAGTAHVNGIYRWLEQVWEAQIMNYGARLMLDFMVPEPAALWRASRDSAAASAVRLDQPEALDLESAMGITVSNYGEYVAKYRATGVTPPPAESVKVTKVFELAELEHQKELDNKDWTIRTAAGVVEIPDGYVAVYADADKATQIWNSETRRLIVEVGGVTIDLFSSTDDGDMSDGGIKGPIEVGILAYDHKAAIVSVELHCNRTAEALAEWQLKTYEAVATAYRLLKDAYDAAVKAAEENAESETSSDLSSDAKREIEKGELKRGALTMLTGSDFSDRGAMSGPTNAKPYPEMDVAKALSEGDDARFFEHAFEWTQMTYVFYPYFWGRQDDWYDVLAETDSDSTFQSFLRAGSSRVQIPVRPGFEEAVLYYIETGRTWGGGDAPVIGDPLYLAMIDEVAEATGLSLYTAVPYSDTWEYSIPTSLVLVKDDAPDVGL